MAVGLKVTDPQALGTVLRVNCGGLFTDTVLLTVKEPQLLVTLSVIVYLPGFLNSKFGFNEVAVVPPVKLQSATVPQKAGV